MSPSTPGRDRFTVVHNDNGRHPIRPSPRNSPAGRQSEASHGTRAKHPDHIETAWQDIRPADGKGRMAATGPCPAPQQPTHT
jgi:uncharacterized protein YbdZ (MbtH family)